MRNKRKKSMNITIPMFEKGRSFVMAGQLVLAYDGMHFVSLHLICQGLECIGKALLLSHDYENYYPVLITKYGHDLEILIEEVNKNSNKNIFSTTALTELVKLNVFYKKHSLRYGNEVDFNNEALALDAENLRCELVESLSWLNEKFSGEASDA